MAQNTQTLISQTQHQQQPSHSNAQLPQHNIGEVNNNGNNNIHSHTHNNNHGTNISGNSNTDDLNENGNNSNNNANQITNNNNNNIILTTQPQHATMFGSIGLSNTNTQQIYMNPATGAVHAAHPPHTQMFSTMTHMGNGLYVNNIPANVNIPTAGGWTYLQGSGYAELQTDANGAILQTLPGLQTIQGVGINSTAAQQAQDQAHHPQSMNMRGMRRLRSRGGVPRNIPRHARDYNNRHHQHVQHGNVSSATDGTVDLSIAQQTIVDGAQTIMTATGPGTACTPTQYNTQPQYPHAPAPATYQYAYPAYFATQNPILHPGTHTAVTAQTNASGQPVYVSSLPIYNTQQLYNCSYIYPSVVNSTEYQYIPGAEEVQTVAFDARQSSDGSAGGALIQQHQLWHPNNMFPEDYTVNPEMSAVPVTLVPVRVGCDEYPQNSALDSAETLSPNYALYETPQIPDITQQIGCLQIYDEPQHVNVNNSMSKLACDDIQLESTDEVSECPVGLPLAQETLIIDNNNSIMQPDYLIENINVTSAQDQQISALVNDQKQQELIENCNYIANAKMNCNVAAMPDDIIQKSQPHTVVLEREKELSYDSCIQQQTSPKEKDDEATSLEPIAITTEKTETTINNALYSNAVQNLELLANARTITPPQQTTLSQTTSPTTTKAEGSSSSGVTVRCVTSGKQASGAQSTNVIKQQQQNQQRQSSFRQCSQTEPENRKLSSSNSTMITTESSNSAQQKNKQQIRRKHSAAEQTVSSLSGSVSMGNDKYMQTTKTMSWTNSSSQHKKSTTSVAVTATPDGNPQHGRKHNSVGQTQSGHQQQQLHLQNINSSVSTTRNQSSMNTSMTSPTNNTSSNTLQRIDKPKSKSNFSTISTSTASTTVVPNQLAQQLNTTAAATLRGSSQKHFEVIENTEFKNSTEKEIIAPSIIKSKQYPGFEQKKAIPRTISPTTVPTVVPTICSKPETDNTAATMSTNGLDDAMSSRAFQSSALIDIADNIDMNLAPQVQLQHSISVPTAAQAPATAKNVTTSWASLFNGGGSAQQSAMQTAPNTHGSTSTASKASLAGSIPHLPIQGRKQLSNQKSSTQAIEEKPQIANNEIMSATALGASIANTVTTAQTLQQTPPTPITPGPMSYSAASAQGLSVANSTSGSNYSNTTTGVSTTPATAVPSHTKQAQKLDEWTTKYAEFLTKQKTDLNPISLRPRGLTNRSNYCYINSTLQALLGCSPLYNLVRAIPKQMAVLSSVKTPTINAMMNFMGNFSTMPSGMRLRTNTRRGASHKGVNKDDLGAELQCDSAFEPTEIYKLWNESRKEEGEGRQEDAEEFLGYVLNKLNDEMEEIINLIAKPKTQQNGQSGEQSEGEDGDAWQMICSYRNRSSITRQNDYRSTPLSDIFRGELRSRLLREGEHSTDVIQPFYTLQLNIEKVTSVKEALEVLSGRDQLEGVTGSKTKQEVLAWQQMTIEKLPIILILHLKYFDYRQDGLNKILKKVDFPVELKIDPKIMGTKKYPLRQRTYRLIAVVYHDGKEASKGHYIADVYHTGYSSWLRYDDNSVKPVSENHVLVPRSPRVPYLLYYRRCDTMPQHPSQPAQQQQQQQQQSSHQQSNHVANSQAHTYAGGDHRSARH